MLQDIDIKYIDPTYMIRAIPTTTNDRIYCKVLGQGAVHGAFAGFTGCTVGLVNTHYVYLPIPVIIQVPPLSLDSKSTPAQQCLSILVIVGMRQCSPCTCTQPSHPLPVYSDGLYHFVTVTQHLSCE